MNHELEYEMYCVTDPEFYDRLTSDVTDEDLLSPLRGDATPTGWTRLVVPGWVNYVPPGGNIPAQGWKVHVSSTIEQVEDIARRVFKYCIKNCLMFKVVPTEREYFGRNAKYGERAGGGKLVTIYPEDEGRLEAVVTELGKELAGIPGPYVLSDLRWQDGPIYVRYGAFAPRMVRAADGRWKMAIENQEGDLVPDLRGPVFAVPEWVKIPDFLQPALASRDAARIDELPYELLSALHYSNGGGVYKGRDKRTEERVVVKEGRPHAGVDGSGRDAVTRLRHERDILTRLQGLDAVPELKGYHRVAGHEFLIEELVEGDSLYSVCGTRNPLLRYGDPGPRALHEYRIWAMDIWERIAQAVHAIHDRGVIFGDLHMHNILCHEAEGESRIRLIDFEGGWLTAQGGRQVMANPGFVAPRGYSGTAVDEYALAALKFALFAPMTPIFRYNLAKVSHLADIIVNRFGVPKNWFGDALRSIPRPLANSSSNLRSISADPEVLPKVCASITQAIFASATPEHSDRYFPGDAAQFASPGAALGMAYGAAGVLWALHATGVKRVPEAEEWLLSRVFRSPSEMPHGFYDGSHGIAYALWDLDRHDEATDLLARISKAKPDTADLSLFHGLSGMGLNWLHFARVCSDNVYLQRAIHFADIVCDGLGGVEDVAEISGGTHPHAGLMYGSSGPALFLTAAFETTGESRYLDAAEVALRQDLRRCKSDDQGALYVDEGFRLMPYLAVGSAGIGVALDRYLALRPDRELEAQLTAIGRATRSQFYLFPGLFEGQGGMALVNASRPHGFTTADEEHDAANAAETQVNGLNWHVLNWKGHTAFPGSQLLRMSMDLATGSAGILLALAAVGAAPTPLPLSLPFFLQPHQGSPAGVERERPRALS
ncbi:class III lanthionine synthetase LanKC [Streptomyces sp. NPDC055078]